MKEFQDIYRKYGEPIYRFLLSLTENEDMAEELLQETFYRALLHIDQFEGRSSIYTWLCQIAKNAWLKECRRNKWFVGEPDVGQISPLPSPEQQCIKKDEYLLLHRTILHLENPYRDVFILHIYGDLKLK